jgi:membrane protein DedA with SNARE-associated domain
LARVLELAAFHIHHHGPSLDYAGIGAAALISWAGVPGAGEAALIAGGVLAARHKLDLGGVVVIACLGATAGGIVGWLIGLKVGNAVAIGPGPLRGTRRRLVASGRRFYDRFGVIAVFFTPSWVAGINQMRARRYLLANAVSAILWAVAVGVGAFAIGPTISDVFTDVGTGGVVAIAVVVAITLALRFVRRRRAA